MNNSVIMIALVDFKLKQVESLIEFAERYSSASCPGDVWECICNCVDLWRKADEALKGLKDEK